MSIPLTITLTKPTQNKYETLYYICNDLDDCYNKVIIAIKNLIMFKTDYPPDYDEFKNLIWYNLISFDNEVFDYNIFFENKWIKPWDHQELYDNVLDIIHKNDVQDSIYNNKNYYDGHSDDEDENDH